MILNYLDEGTGEVIIFVHSYLWDKEMWKPQIEFLKKKYRCIAIDLPGHGNSPCLENIHSKSIMNDMADSISQLISNLKIESYSYVGLSIGGMIAPYLYRKDKNRIKKMVLMDTYLGKENEESKIVYSTLLKQVELENRISDKIAEKIVPLFFSEKLLGRKHKLYNKLFTKVINIESNKIKTLVNIGRAINEREDLLNELEKISIPLFFIVGEYDIPRPVFESEKMVKLKKDAPLFKIKNAGHISNLENIDEVNSILEKILK